MRNWVRDRLRRAKKKLTSGDDTPEQQEAASQTESPPEAPPARAAEPERGVTHEPPGMDLTPSAAEAAGAVPITGQASGRVGQRARSRRRGGRGRGRRGGQRQGTAAEAQGQAPAGTEEAAASSQGQQAGRGAGLLPGESRAGRSEGGRSEPRSGGGRGEGRESRGGRGGEGGREGRGGRGGESGREARGGGGRGQSGRGQARPRGGEGQSRREREREREARRERGRIPHTGPAPLTPLYPDIAPTPTPLPGQEPEAALVKEAPEDAPAAAGAARRQGGPRGVVVLAIGLPGSGKTSWFRRRGVTPLSSDMMRHLLFDDATEQRHQNLVFSTLRSMLRSRLIVGMPINYVDATNLSPNERRQWIKMAESFGYEVQAVFFDVPLEVCVERNRKRQRTVTDEAMQRMAEKLTPPKFEEGFSKIVVVRVKREQAAE